jgi:hypothetical protein
MKQNSRPFDFTSALLGLLSWTTSYASSSCSSVMSVKLQIFFAHLSWSTRDAQPRSKCTIQEWKTRFQASNVNESTTNVPLQKVDPTGNTGDYCICLEFSIVFWLLLLSMATQSLRISEVIQRRNLAVCL